MRLYHVWAEIGGYLVVLIRGAALERLLNLASANGIYLWDIRRYRPDFMVVSVGPRGFRALRPYLRRTHCRAAIKRRRGLPFLWRRLARRPGFLAGFALFAATIGILTGFVWRIEVVGAERLPRAAILRSLRRLGLYEGVWRGRLDKDGIEKRLAIATPDADWLGLEIRGMVAVVRVVERILPPRQRSGGDLVAARDGLITGMVVYRGTPAVAEGETVHAGQLLVSGVEVRADAAGQLAPRKVPASARVRARVWDEARSLVPLAFWRLVPTGRRTSALRLRLGPWQAVLGSGRPPYIWFQQSRSRHSLRIGRNTPPLVELTIDRYREARPVLCRRDRRAAAALAAAEARARLGTGQGVRIAVQDDGGWVTAIATRESVEEIAVPDGRETGAEIDRRSTTTVRRGE
ncbi:MAG: sporulation protein YqfD [Patescibacteria group bacterium]